MTDTTQIQYPGEALDTTKRQIRLLTVLPGPVDSLITCNLQIVDVENAGDYEALSYTWGTSPSSHPIILNGKEFHVGNNLFVALSQLRLSEAHRVLWIDAICIDQSNVSERNHQVQQMADIYSRAKQVVVWLGPGTESSRQAIEFLRESYLTQGPLRRIAAIKDERWDCLQVLCERPYWTRVWIIQEICLASRILIVCGSDKMPWSYITAFRRARLHIWHKYYTEEERTFMRSHPARIDEQRTGRKTQGAVLWNLLESFQDSQCKVSHDRVYGLLALSTDCGSSGIPIDYSMPHYQLYRHIMEFYHKHYHLSDKSPSAGAQLMKLSDFLQRFFRQRLSKRVPQCLLTGGFSGKAFTIPICNAAFIDEFLPSSRCDDDPPNAVPLHLRAEFPYPDRLREWARLDERITKHDNWLETLEFATLDPKIPRYRPPKFSVQRRTPFLGGLLRRTVTPRAGAHERPPQLASSYFIGIAPPGSKLGDLVCSFVDSNVAVVVRPRASRRPQLLQHRKVPGKRLVLTDNVDYYSLSRLLKRYRLVSRCDSSSKQFEDELEELDRRKCPEQYDIIGRAFFDFAPLSKMDGITTRLTRDKQVETTQTGDIEVNPWIGSLTINLETLQRLSIPGVDQKERMTHDGNWVPVEDGGG